MSRGTKIVATIGPASNDLPTLIRMIKAGVDVVRAAYLARMKSHFSDIKNGAA